MSDTRSPQVAVLVNGAVLPGIIDVEVASNNHLAANRFRITASLTSSGYDNWVGDVLAFEIQLGIFGSWSSVIYGEADELEFDIGRGEVVVHGRDLTSRFIEARTEETFENRTASDVALLLAARRGLQPAVTPTTTIIGRDFQNSHTKLTLSQHARATTEWDLLIQLAKGEGFDVWVEEETLYFAPPDQTASALVLGSSDCLSIRLQRLLTLSGGLAVTVRSWDARGQRAVLQTASTVAPGLAGRSYGSLRTNLTEDAAQAEAQRLLTQMAQHERSVCIEMPGDLTTRPRDLLTLVDTGTDFDGLWTVTDVERRVSFQGGFTQTLQARIPAWTISSTT